MNYEKLTVFDGNVKENILVMKLLDQNATPDWCDANCNKSLKKTLIKFYKKRQILNIDEALKRRKDLKKLFPRMKLVGSNRKKLIVDIKEKISKKSWKSIDKILKKL